MKEGFLNATFSSPESTPSDHQYSSKDSLFISTYIVEKQIRNLKISGLFLKCGILTLTKMGRSAFPSFTNQVGIPNS